MATNYKQIYATQKKNRERLLKLNPKLNNESGIYFLIRLDDNGIRYAYVGQAKHILDRLCQHLTGYTQHIDLSLRKHGLYADDNVYGWRVGFVNCSEHVLDKWEKYYIRQYAQSGYQLRNKTSGSQGEGKSQIDEYRPQKGYRDGLKQGYKNASKEVSHLFDLHLNYSPKSDKPNKNQLKAVEKFKEFLEYHKGDNDV